MNPHERAKKDYATGLYSWYELRSKYSSLSINEIFAIIFAVRDCSINPDTQKHTTKNN